LHRDPETRRTIVSLERAIFEHAWQNEVAAASAQTSHAAFEGGPSVARVVELARSVLESMSRMAEGLLARAPVGSVACREGCDHCCYQAVGVTPPEALAIFAHLGATRSEAELASVFLRVAEARARTRNLSATERFSPEHPCVFLESGRCSIYEVRPLSCRGMNSLDADECAKRLRDPEARAAFVANGAGSRSFLEPIRAFHAVSAGLQLALAELHRLDMRPLDLIAAIHLLFTEGESVARAWARGARAFEPALGGDSTGTLGIDGQSALAERS
ncbi:MAG TPA: YkgJ family cysteine cluster protein, partial [Polyangiaceae bacterium]